MLFRSAATGVVSVSGEVGTVGALRQKVRAAQRAGAEILVVPAGNCADLQGFSTPMTVVKATTLNDAIASLEALKDPATADQAPRC